MASILETLMQQVTGGGALEQISANLGTDRQTAGTAVAAALPALLGALSKNAATPQGAQSLNAALQRDHDGSLLNNLAGFLGSGQTAPGQGILNHVLGARQPVVEKGIGQSTGLDPAATGKLLAMLAPVVMGALGQAQRQQKMDANGLATMLGQERETMARHAPQQMGALNALLDADGDGDVDLQDVAKKGLGLLGGLFGQR
ncbi:MAG: DUF937 domain-containing protein [Gemmatimonadetes bacterium]|nr:DUF937 domain-containing protein [Gemmatimonadota bacterium]